MPRSLSSLAEYFSDNNGTKTDVTQDCTAIMLLDLAYELQFAIVNELESDKDISAFSQSHRVLYSRFNSYLYRHNVQHHAGVGLLRAAKFGQETSIRNFLEEGANADISNGERPSVTPIELAIRGNHFEAAKMLLLADGADEHQISVRANRALLESARCGNEEVIMLLLQRHGTSFRYQDSDIWIALNSAANKSYEGIVLLLLGAVTKKFNESPEAEIIGYKLLSTAAWRGLEKSVKVLLDKGCPITGDDENDIRAPLYRAACRGYTEIVKLLIAVDDGIGPDPKNEALTEVIYYASRYGHVETVKYLIETFGVNPETQMVLSQKAMQDALGASSDWEYDNRSLVKLLLDEYGVALDHRFSENGDTPLTLAAKKGHTTTVKLLLEEYGDNPETRGPGGRTPLFIAASSGHSEMAKFLLDKYGVDVESKDDDGRTPLIAAIVSTNGEQVLTVLLQDDRVNPNFPDNNGVSPLSWAARRSNSAVKKLLADKRLDPNTQDLLGRTALSWAAQRARDIEFRTLFADSRVDPKIADGSGRTAFSWAMEGRPSKTVIELMLADSRIDPNSSDGDGRTPLSYAVERIMPQGRATKAIIQLLLADDRVDPDEADVNGRTSLSWAVNLPPMENDYDGDANPAIGVLLMNGRVAPDSRDKGGRTPLSWAAEQIRGDAAHVAALLADTRVDPNSRDENGRTPLSWAAEKGGLQQVKLLLEDSRVDRNSEDKDGRTPLFWAASNNNSQVEEILLEAGCS